MEGIVLIVKVEYFPRKKIYIYVYLDFPKFMFSSVERANRLAFVSGEIKRKRMLNEIAMALIRCLSK